MDRKSWLAAAVMVALCGGAQAALFDRGGGMVYDSSHNITWISDLSLAKTLGEANGGLMTWDDANKWAAGLSNGGFSSGWRLPTLDPMDPTCSIPTDFANTGSGCTSGELSHLFVVDLGAKDGEGLLEQAGDTDVQKANQLLFQNLMDDNYWSGTQFDLIDTYAFNVGFVPSTFQGIWDKAYTFHVPLVRDGDVAMAVPVPEPQTLVLVGLALSAMVVLRRGRKPSRSTAAS